MKDELAKVIKSSSDWVISSVNADFKVSFLLFGLEQY